MTARPLLIVCSALLLSGCHSEAGGDASQYDLSVQSDQSLIPGNVVLSVYNRSSFPICISISETSIGGGSVALYPPEYMTGDNRPPPTLLNGVDVSEGIYIIVPRKKIHIFVGLPDVIRLNNVSLKRVIKGKVRAYRCDEIFDTREKFVKGSDRNFDTKID